MNPLSSVEIAYFVLIHEERHNLITKERVAEAGIVTFGTRSNEITSLFCLYKKQVQCL